MVHDVISRRTLVTMKWNLCPSTQRTERASHPWHTPHRAQQSRHPFRAIPAKISWQWHNGLQRDNNHTSQHHHHRKTKATRTNDNNNNHIKYWTGDDIAFIINWRVIYNHFLWFVVTRLTVFAVSFRHTSGDTHKNDPHHRNLGFGAQGRVFELGRNFNVRAVRDFVGNKACRQAASTNDHSKDRVGRRVCWRHTIVQKLEMERSSPLNQNGTNDVRFDSTFCVKPFGFESCLLLTA